MNEAKCVHRGKWFRSVRLLASGAFLTEFDSYLVQQFGTEAKYQDALDKDSEEEWHTRWSTFISRVKVSIGLDDSSEVADAS